MTTNGGYAIVVVESEAVTIEVRHLGEPTRPGRWRELHYLTFSLSTLQHGLSRLPAIITLLRER